VSSIDADIHAYMLDKAKKDHDSTLIKLEEWLRETT